MIKRSIRDNFRKVTANRRHITIDEEAAFLEPYRQLSGQGHILDIREIECVQNLTHNCRKWILRRLH